MDLCSEQRMYLSEPDGKQQESKDGEEYGSTGETAFGAGDGT